MSDGQESRFSTTTMGDILGRSASTVRNWTDEFAAFLSPLATVGSGRDRYYNHDDLKVFLLVKQMRDTGSKSEEIAEALSRNEQLKMELPSELVLAGDSDVTPEVALELARYHIKKALEDRELALQKAEEYAKLYSESNEKVIRLAEELNNSNARILELRQKLMEAGEGFKAGNKKIESLLREMKDVWREGFMEGMRMAKDNKEDKDKKE